MTVESELRISKVFEQQYQNAQVDQAQELF